MWSFSIFNIFPWRQSGCARNVPILYGSDTYVCRCVFHCCSSHSIQTILYGQQWRFFLLRNSLFISWFIFLHQQLFALLFCFIGRKIDENLEKENISRPDKDRNQVKMSKKKPYRRFLLIYFFTPQCCFVPGLMVLTWKKIRRKISGRKIMFANDQNYFISFQLLKKYDKYLQLHCAYICVT